MTPRPHDLLRIALAPGIIPDGAPGWVRSSLAATPWVVTRRARPLPEHRAAGVRGPTRAHRYALVVPLGAVREVVTPEQLSRADLTRARPLPAIDALHTLRPFLAATGLAWGPTGAVGYELATSAAVTHADSDLDLAVYCGHAKAVTRRQLDALDRILRPTAARIDCQIEYPCGAVALNDILAEAAQVLLRTPCGPRLIPAQNVLP